MTANPFRWRVVGSDGAVRSPARRPADALTLREFFDGYFAVDYVQANRLNASTRAGYGSALIYWERLSDNPPIGQTSQRDANDFMARLADEPGRWGELLAPQTQKNLAGNLTRVFGHSGPACRDFPDARGLVERPPFFNPPKVPKREKKLLFGLDQYRAMYVAASQMKRPRPLESACSTGLWWRTLLCLLYYGGLRIEETSRLEFSMVEGDVIVIPAAVRKRRESSLVQYLHADVRDHVALIAQTAAKRPTLDARRTILHWPHDSRHLATQFDVLMAAAGIPKQKGLGFHGARRTHSTVRTALVSEMGIDKGMDLVRQSLGHAKLETTIKHYIDGRQAAYAQKPWIDAMPRIVAGELAVG